MKRPRLAISIGCPSGIGPEVAVLAAAKKRPHGADARALLVGDLATLQRAAETVGVEPARLVPVATPDAAWTFKQTYIPVWQPTATLREADRACGKPAKAGGAAQLAWIDAACDLVRLGSKHGGADALVTGPVSKEAVVRSKAPGSADFLGHTEHLQRRLKAREVVMAFWSPELTTALVTTHLALADVPAAVTPAAVARATYWLARLLRDVGHARPRLAVASLNPHAGEGGLLGSDETKHLVPGIERARVRLDKEKLLADLVGPVPAESAFRLAVRTKHGDRSRFDGVVAMYHDQATIPMKLVGFGEAVNVTLALPIVRTSVDHGTAYDRAGKGTADPRGMREAIKLAVILVRARSRLG